MLKRLNTHAHKLDVTPRTREILQNEKRYGSKSPEWTMGKDQRPAQTADEAEALRHQLVKRLRRHAANNPTAQALANRLDGCAPAYRCMSGGCPECNRAYCRWFVSSAATLLQEHGGEIAVLSLVHADLSVPVGELTPEHLRTAKKTIRKILTKAGVTTFVGGVDISANEDETGRVEPYYQIQSWILAPTDQVKSAERQLRKVLPKTETTPRPVKILPWDGELAALAYGLKNTFDRRVSIICEDPSGRRGSFRDTRGRRLRIEQQIELAIMLDRVGLHARLHLGGCRVVHTANGPMIRLIGGEKGKGEGDQ